ncbi:hypothetical protein J2P12_04870 [Candidatus Bathyarchaeota archaeon]|nr:hypothetical protein [Candidatus Bathyarchaeota archaeon]
MSNISFVNTVDGFGVRNGHAGTGALANAQPAAAETRMRRVRYSRTILLRLSALVLERMFRVLLSDISR